MDFMGVHGSLQRRTGTNIWNKHISKVKNPDHYTFLGNCPPTPPLSQHFLKVWPQDNQEEFQLAARVGIEREASGLQF